MFLSGKFNPPRKPHWRRHRRNRMKYIRPICRPQRKQARKRIAADYYFNISRQAVSWNKLRYEYVRDKAECIFSFSQKGLIFEYGIRTPRRQLVIPVFNAEIGKHYSCLSFFQYFHSLSSNRGHFMTVLCVREPGFIYTLHKDIFYCFGSTYISVHLTCSII